ncbi:MAG: methionyl-tRNA formyltransferase [Thermodesulforhabdaceae bacterium]|jgi:methionyl-tRNA formyltransferase
MQFHKHPSVVFFGTPEFALPTLESLVEAGCYIPLVVTAPDRPKGRGLRLTPPPVKTLALSLGLRVFQPEKLKNSETISAILDCKPDVLVVVAYGKLIPPELFQAVPFGALNVHPSLLPKYRGPAPIQRAVLAGENITGVTIMLIDEGLDSGPILASRSIPVKPFETAGELSERLACEGASLLVETLDKWLGKEITPQPQNHDEATFAPAIQKEETKIYWEQPGQNIVNVCRAFDPTPGAYTIFKGRRIKCFSAKIASMKFPKAVPGEVVGFNEEGLLVCTGDGDIVVMGELQIEGKKRLPAKEFVKGVPDIVGSKLGE